MIWVLLSGTHHRWDKKSPYRKNFTLPIASIIPIGGQSIGIMDPYRDVLYPTDDLGKIFLSSNIRMCSELICRSYKLGSGCNQHSNNLTSIILLHGSFHLGRNMAPNEIINCDTFCFAQVISSIPVF
jgi:hypothetical protein